jgi:methionyl-tRNA formyltransferase
MNQPIKFVYFGSSRFSEYVLDELKKADFFPLLDITSAKEPLPSAEELRALDADVFIVASFGKILSKEILSIPKFGALNVHPSLLPILRGPAPIQGTILGQGTPGVSIIQMDEEMDHGPLLAQEEVAIDPWPDHYDVVEEKLARKGGELLALVLPTWIDGTLTATPQDHTQATFIKFIKKEDGLLDLQDDAEKNLRKVFAYSTWPSAHFFFKKKTGDEVRVVVKDATIKDGIFVPTRVIPAGKKEMNWQDFLRGNA